MENSQPKFLSGRIRLGIAFLVLWLLAPVAAAQTLFHPCMSSEVSLWTNAAIDAQREAELIKILLTDTETLPEAQLRPTVRTLLSQTLKEVYDISAPAEPTVRAADISDVIVRVRDPQSGWKRIGVATSDDVRDIAASEAQSGKPVIGILDSSTTRLGLIVLAGGTRYSDTWQANVPRVAVRSTAKQFSFVGCRLSVVIAKRNAPNVVFYVYDKLDSPPRNTESD